MAADWKKIVLHNTAAELAAITASVGVNLGGSIPDGAAGLNVLVVDGSGNVQKIAQETIEGTDTTYTASTGLNLDSNNTFSVVPGEISHSELFGYDDAEHINWSVDTSAAGGSEVIHADNYTNNVYVSGEGVTVSTSGTESDTVATNADQSHVTSVGTLTSGAISSNFGNIDIGSSDITTTGDFTASVLKVTNLAVTDDTTVGGTLNADTINAGQVNITGSLEVDGSIVYNAASFVDVVTQQFSGSNSWGDANGTSNHYFTGSISASGGISASTFTGNGSGLTGINTSNVTTAALTAGNGLEFTGDGTYDGSAGKTLKAKVLDGGGLVVEEGGISIATSGIVTTKINNSAVTSPKIAAGAVTATKLSGALITAMTSNATIQDADLIMVSSGSTPALGKMTVGDLKTYIDNSLTYTNNAGTVTGVAAEHDVQGLTLSVTGTPNVEPTMSLTGTVEINNSNWNGAVLGFANGGTGQSTLAGAAEALLSIYHNGLTIGTAADTITIPGNLDVQGDLVTLNSTQLEIKDTFIHIGSGSAGTNDIGIKFGNTTNVGNTLFWDGGYNTDEGRFAVGYNIGSVDTDDVTSITAAYHIAGVYSGSGTSADVNADQIGNIKLVAGEAFIYA